MSNYACMSMNFKQPASVTGPLHLSHGFTANVTGPQKSTKKGWNTLRSDRTPTY